MGTKYPSQSVSNYNQNPPTDDGQQIASNEIEWQKHLDNIGAPLKTTLENINSALTSHFDNGPDAARSTNYTIIATDYGKLIRCTATLTLTVTASLGTGFTCTIKNDSSAGNITITPAGGDTIDGQASISLSSGQWAIIHGDETGTNYSIMSNNNASGAIILPAGIVMAWPDTEANIPANDFLYCDGDAVSRTTYSELFDVIGTKYGSGDGSTTFNLPDYRGEFLRGLNDTSGNDPDAATRTNRGDGTTGDNVGTKQDEDIAPHYHDISTQGDDNFDATGGGTIIGKDGGSLSGTLTQRDDKALNEGTDIGNETRPRNVAVLYVISTGKIPVNPNIIAVLDSERPILSVNATDSEHDVDFTAGKVISDDGTTVMANGALTKQIDTAFVAGTNQGGWPSGLAYPSVARSTVHVFLISTPGGTVDFGFDTSVTATNLMADTNVVAGGYTKKRRVASILIDVTNNLIDFTQMGNRFYVDSYTFRNTSPAVNLPGSTDDVGCPHDIDGLIAILGGFYSNLSAITSYHFASTNADERPDIRVGRGITSDYGLIGPVEFPVDSSGQIESYRTSSATTSAIEFELYGWIDNLDLA